MQTAVTASLIFICAASYAFSQFIMNHYDRSFLHRWALKGKINGLFWNPQVSRKNRYDNRNPMLGERFWGASHVFAFTTEAHSLFNWIGGTAIQLALALNIEWSAWSVLWLIGIKVVYSAMYTTSYQWLKRRKRI